MSRLSPIPLTVLSLWSLLCGCAGEARDSQGPAIQDSTDKTPRWQVDINRVRDGVLRTHSPGCLDELQIGHTVEFRNFMPEIPTNVTGLSGPAPLYSPNLVRPYRYVGPEDPSNTLCDREQDGGCAERPACCAYVAVCA